MKISRNLPVHYRVAYVLAGGLTMCTGFMFVKMPFLLCVLSAGGLLALFGVIGFCPIRHSVKGGQP